MQSMPYLQKLTKYAVALCLSYYDTYWRKIHLCVYIEAQITVVYVSDKISLFISKYNIILSPIVTSG